MLKNIAGTWGHRECFTVEIYSSLVYL